jgi:hypothetical protein
VRALHAGYITLIARIAADHAALPGTLLWCARIMAPGAALLVSGGFFGVGHLPALRTLLYAGAVLLVSAALLLGIGLLRAPGAL